MKTRNIGALALSFVLILTLLTPFVCALPPDPLILASQPTDGELLVVPNIAVTVIASVDSANGSSMKGRCWTNATGVFEWSNWVGPFANTTLNWAINASKYATTYYWGCYANDSWGNINNETFTFTTRGNYPPAISDLTVPDTSTGCDTYLVWQCNITDQEGFSFNWNISCNNGDYDIGTVDTNGTKTLVMPTLAYSTTYTIWVNATENIGGLSTSEAYTFTTEDAPIPASPVSLTDAIVPVIMAFVTVVFILGLIGLVMKSFERWGK